MRKKNNNNNKRKKNRITNIYIKKNVRAKIDSLQY